MGTGLGKGYVLCDRDRRLQGIVYTTQKAADLKQAATLRQAYANAKHRQAEEAQRSAVQLNQQDRELIDACSGDSEDDPWDSGSSSDSGSGEDREEDQGSHCLPALPSTA